VARNGWIKATKRYQSACPPLLLSTLPPRIAALRPILLSSHILLPRLFPLFIRALQINSYANRSTANTNTTPTSLAFLPHLGSRKLPKPNSYRAISNQGRQTPFQPETKDFGNARVCFTVFKRPFPIGIHYDQVPDFSQYAEATPTNIQSLVKAVTDFETELTKADKCGTQFIWLPMVRLASSLSYMPLDWSIPFWAPLYLTSQTPCNPYFLTMPTPSSTPTATYTHPHALTFPLTSFPCAAPARRTPHFFLTPLPKMCQADTSYQGAAGRWVKVIKHKPHVGNNWSTVSITAAEKAKTLFLATLNEVHQQMNYSKVPTPHGGKHDERRTEKHAKFAQRLSQLLLIRTVLSLLTRISPFVKGFLVMPILTSIITRNFGPRWTRGRALQ